MKKLIYTAIIMFIMFFTTTGFSQNVTELESNIMSASTKYHICDCGAIRIYHFNNYDIFKIEMSLVSIYSRNSEHVTEDKYFVYQCKNYLVYCNYGSLFIAFYDHNKSEYHEQYCPDK